ncbi:hypothetical protein PQQ72_02130 [Paraburkholderia strydomiana]|uniref:hypothetical protein n=1 Tax=Paraburkholderia strydomiana TaxID=1245417 RepID=UPI0038B73582
MRFTEYVVLESADKAIDPLGFRRPAGALQDLLFPQFTVLTIRPVYLSSLCGILDKLADETFKEQQLSQRFRALEIYWGIANASVNSSIINVTKYQRLLGEQVHLAGIPKRHPIYQRLSYGTLGHYSSAALRWGLVERNGRTLSPLGRDLADAFSSRNRALRFRDLLAMWQDNQVVSQVDFERAGEHYGLDASVSRRESEIWRELIDNWCKKNPRVEALWRAPPKWQTLQAGFANASAYQTFWTDASQQYDGLAIELTAIARFERLAAATQFVLDLRIASLEYGDTFRDVLPQGAEPFAAAVTALAAAYLAAPAFHDSRHLFARIAQSAGDFAALTHCVVDHHVEHQTAKGTSPIVNHDELLVTGRVNPVTLNEALATFDNASDDAAAQLDGLQYLYRRQWHFEKCRSWHDWAFPQTETVQ